MKRVACVCAVGSVIWSLYRVGVRGLFVVQFVDIRTLGKEKPPNNQAVISIKWWRRRESNPRPQALCHWFYMLIPTLI